MDTELESRIGQALEDAKPPSPKTARSIIVVGAGGIVHDAHLPAYQRAVFPVAALVDANLQKASALAEKFGVPLATNSIDEAVRKSPKDSVFDVAVPAKSILDILPLLPDG